MRLLVLSLLRAGKIEATSKGQTIDSATGVEARDTFSNNNLFRQASFRPKKGIEIRGAGESVGSLPRHLRERGAGAQRRRDRRRASQGGSAPRGHRRRCARVMLTAHRLPGGDGARRRHRPDEGHPPWVGRQRHRNVQRVASRPSRTRSSAPSNSSRRSPSRASTTWSGHDKRSGLAWPLPAAGGRHRRRPSDARRAALDDLLARETFFRELPAIEQHAQRNRGRVRRRYDEALDARVAAYTKAFDQLVKTPGWSEIDEDAAAPDRGAARARHKRRTRHACRFRSSAPSATRASGACARPVAELRRIIDGERVVTGQPRRATSPVASRPRSSSTPRSTGSARSARG